MNPKDRGDIKWHGFIMPEQAAMIAEARAEFEREEKPYVDSYTAEQNSAKLAWAAQHGLLVTVKRWHDGSFEVLTGTTPRLKAADGRVHIETAGGVERLLPGEIIYVDIDAD